MSAGERELRELQQTVSVLSRRVEALERASAVVPAGGEETPAAPRPAASSPRPAVAASARRTAPAAPAPARAGAAADPMADADPLARLRACFAALEATEDVKDVPRLFSRFAQRSGARMLLLKRWNSGLEVLLAEGADRARLSDDLEKSAEERIPVRDDDLFAAVAADRTVYAGPVPVKHFPLDLALLLGRGQDRQIVLLPLPLRGRWNTYILLETGGAERDTLVAAEALARFALGRLLLLEHGDRTRPKRTPAILEQELARRGGAARQGWEDRAGPAPRPSPPVGTPAPTHAPAGARTEGTRAAATRETPAPPERPAPPPPRGAAARAEPRAPAAPPVARAAPPVAGAAAAARAASPVAFATAPAVGLLEPPATSAAPEPRPAVPVAPPEGDAAADLARRVGDLPALPRVANHILALIADPNTTATKLEKAIVLDQALTAKILKIANSSFYGGLRDVHTVGEAIVRLGFVTIRNWTLATAARSVFLDAGAAPGLQQIWQQSVLSAMAAQLVAEKVRYPAPESVFVGGLMQNIGQLALAKVSPDAFEQILRTSAEAQVPYYFVEKEVLGFDHGALGALLIREWNLSDDLEEAVRTHHRLEEAGPARRLAAMIALGEEIADCSGSVPDEGLTIWEMSEAARVLEITEPDYVDLVERAHRLRIDPRLFG